MKRTVFTRAAVGAAASVAVLLPLAACSNSDSDTQSPSTRPTTTTTPSASPSPSNSSPSTADYKDGTYTVRGVYGGAPSYITVTLTLTDDTINDVQVGLMPDNNDTSRGYQERFAAAAPDEVNGKSIDGLSVGKIAGASGCSDGFNDALTKIRDQASTNN